MLGADPRSPTSVLVASSPDDRMVLSRVGLTGAPERLLTVPQALADAISSSGTQILYVQGHRPPALWAATIADHRLVGATKLAGDPGAAAW